MSYTDHLDAAIVASVLTSSYDFRLALLREEMERMRAKRRPWLDRALVPTMAILALVASAEGRR